MIADKKTGIEMSAKYEWPIKKGTMTQSIIRKYLSKTVSREA
jgi:hypothetical protein